MNYNPKCDSCKHFVTTNKAPKIFKRKSFPNSIWFREYTGYCKLSYCKKEKKQVYRKNMHK